MKKLAALLLALLSVSAWAQISADDILGHWLSESGKAKIEVFKSGTNYYGKIIWLKVPNDETGKPKTDRFNPNPDERKHHLIGLLLLKSMQFDGESTWHNGTIYDPENGK